MSRMKKQQRMEKLASGGLIPAPDPQLAAYQQRLIEQMRAASPAVTYKYVTGSTTTNLTGYFTPSSSKFSGSEFSMGTAIGVRSWNIDRLGRLESPSYSTTWTPDEMVARCKSNPFDFMRSAAGRADSEHRQSECSCGFYAYYEGFNEYAQSDRITGVIEGYGETQIGTRGFKSAKARIVALHVPDDSADISRIGKTPFARVRDNYGPHVAIFSDYSQMVSEFPTTEPETAPTPDSDPDFWTRSI